ncbi:GRP family sugar transporter [Bacillus sp. V59.32b]|uniref:GRP family sugar transporter n=1 Tax=Bacillus sp. V59.32b TaxID=1758642 RepID=UPI000E3BE193|nr:GRP family sugar transporter [Bacillus sp. V59.32b]RFU68259.1 glucose transporter GlcU [Bacillus sp. V59.32b]
MEGILFALLPAVMWGSIVLVSVKLGGNAYSQTLGITFGSMIFAIVMFFINKPDMSTVVWVVGIISGISWAVGQLYQLNSVKYMGVSKTVPISTGMQLLGTTLFGVIVFREWTNTTTIVLGVIALICIIGGVIFTALGKKGEDDKDENFKKGLLVLVVSSLGFIGYVVIVRWFEIEGWAAILPQSIGMLIGALILSVRHKPFTKYAFRNVLTGLIWAIGNIGLLLANPKVGVAVGFSFSQMGIVISTLGGIFLLGEKKSKRELIFVIIGCALVIAGGVLLGMTKR